MQVRELKEYLANLPDDCDVHIVSYNSHGHDTNLLQVSGNMKCVYLHDHYVIREPKTVRAFDGNEYEVPWP